MDKLSYSLGLGIGRQLSQLGAKNINVDDFAQSIKDALSGKEPAVSDEEAQQIVNQFFVEQEKVKSAAAKAEGENFLAENGKKEGSSPCRPVSSTLSSARATESGRRPPTPWSATTRERSSTERFSTAATVAASTPHSPSTRLSQDGPRVCSSCRRVPSTASSSLTTSLMVSVVPDRPSRLTLLSSSTLSSTR